MHRHEATLWGWVLCSSSPGFVPSKHKSRDSMPCPPALFSILFITTASATASLGSEAHRGQQPGDPLTTSIRSGHPPLQDPRLQKPETRALPVNHSPCWIWPPYLSASCGSPSCLLNSSPKPPEAGGVCQASSWLRQALVPVVPSAWNAFPSSHPSPILSPSPGLYTNSASGGISASPLPSHLSFFLQHFGHDPTHSTFNFCILLTVCTPCQLHGGRDLGLFCSLPCPQCSGLHGAHRAAQYLLYKGISALLSAVACLLCFGNFIASSKKSQRFCKILWSPFVINANSKDSEGSDDLLRVADSVTQQSWSWNSEPTLASLLPGEFPRSLSPS